MMALPPWSRPDNEAVWTVVQAEMRSRQATKADRMMGWIALRTRQPEAGFTLIEALIALAVLSVGAIGLMGVVDDHAARIGALEDRMLMRWAAENRMAARRLGVEPQPEWAQVFGAQFEVTDQQRALGADGLTETVVSVQGPRGGVVLRGYVAW